MTAVIPDSKCWNDHSLTQVKLTSDNHSDKGIVVGHEHPKNVELYKEAHSGFIGQQISNAKNDINPTSNQAMMDTDS